MSPLQKVYNPPCILLLIFCSMLERTQIVGTYDKQKCFLVEKYHDLQEERLCFRNLLINISKETWDRPSEMLTKVTQI